ncbi:MAG: putative arabinose efflux permease, MFS family [Chloroflexi bacterium]|nr:MAG: putative arabinose efflux permease, MFS family [Chloroflexota bacterium]
MAGQQRVKPGFWFLAVSGGMGLFIVQILVHMMGPLLVDMAEDLNVSVAVAGQLSSITAISWFATALLAGPLSDTYGRKKMLLIGLWVATLGTLGMGFAWDFPSAVFFRIMTGFAGIISPSVSALVSDFTPIERRGKGLGIMVVGGNMAAVIGVPLITILAQLVDWRWSFFATGIYAAAIGVYLTVFLPESKPDSTGGLNVFGRMKPLLRHPPMWDLTIVNLLVRATFMAFLTYFPAYLIVSHGISTAQTALPMALIGVGLIVASGGGGALADTKFRLKVPVVGLCLAAVLGVVLFNVDVSLSVAVALGVAFCLAIYTPFPVAITIFSMLGGQRLRGAAMGMVAFSNQGGSLLGPALGGLALGLGGYGALGVLCLGMGALGAAVAVVRLRERRIVPVDAAMEPQ